MERTIKEIYKKRGLTTSHSKNTDRIANFRDFIDRQRTLAGTEEVFPSCRDVCPCLEFATATVLNMTRY
jgi:hypothetical protein